MTRHSAVAMFTLAMDIWLGTNRHANGRLQFVEIGGGWDLIAKTMRVRLT